MAERPRSPLHAPLEPAHDKTIGNGPGGGLHQLSVIVKSLHGAAFTCDSGTMLDEEGRKFSVEAQGSNLTDHLNLINFASLFSGTAVGAPRSFGVRVKMEF